MMAAHPPNPHSQVGEVGEVGEVKVEGEVLAGVGPAAEAEMAAVTASLPTQGSTSVDIAAGSARGYRDWET